MPPGPLPKSRAHLKGPKFILMILPFFSYSTKGSKQFKVLKLSLTNTCTLTHKIYIYNFFYPMQLAVDKAKQGTVPRSNAGLRALLKGPTAVWILWLHRGLNHQPSGSQSCSLAARLQAARGSTYALSNTHKPTQS